MFRLIKIKVGRRNQKPGMRTIVYGMTNKLIYVRLHSKSLQYKSERVVTSRFDRNIFCYMFLSKLTKYKAIHTEMYTGMFSALHFRNFVTKEASVRCRELRGTVFHAS